jgi:putative membrane protein
MSSDFDTAARTALTKCIREIEKRTDAELVLVVRARSHSYAGANYLFGALLAFVGLNFLLFSPVTFHQIWVPIDIALLFVLGAYVSSRSNAIRRCLTRKVVRNKAARAGAAAMFYEAGIANTKAELGVLVYLSLLERRLELIADRGILKAVPALEWNQALFELRQAGKQPRPETLRAGLEKLGLLLAQYLPASAENPNELPDAPRFEL